MEPASPLAENAKRELRARMREVRRVIAADPLARLDRSSTIGERVIAALVERWSNRAAGRRLMAYEALAGEPDLTVLAGWADERGIHVYVPEVDGGALRVTPGDIDPVGLDAVIVPGLAFTRGGHRLGQGGAHFDRFLPRLAPECLRIGVAFHEQLVDTVPLEAHDVTLDLVVTDE